MVVHGRSTGLIGRDREIETLQALVEGGERLVMMTGPGGVGKTSLAHHIEKQWVRDGGIAWLVRCERWNEPESLHDFVADQIGGGPGDAAAQISARFAGGDGLLVLDNLEHLIAAGPAIAALVHMDERVRIVGTSCKPYECAASGSSPSPRSAQPQLSC